MRSDRGKVVRADYRVEAHEPPRRRAWSQALAGTPFERLLREHRTEVALAPDGDGTAVTLSVTQRGRGTARLGMLHDAPREPPPARRGARRARGDAGVREQVFWGWGEPGAGPELPEHADAFLREELGLDRRGRRVPGRAGGRAAARAGAERRGPPRARGGGRRRARARRPRDARAALPRQELPRPARPARRRLRGRSRRRRAPRRPRAGRRGAARLRGGESSRSCRSAAAPAWSAAWRPRARASPGSSRSTSGAWTRSRPSTSAP